MLVAALVGNEGATMEKVKAGFFIFIGLLVIAGAIAVALQVNRFIKDSIVAPGRVASLNAGGAHPEIEFTTAVGQKVSYPQGGWIGGYKPGDWVRVRYRPEAPRQTATLDRFGALWFWPTLLLLFGVGGLWAGWSEWPETKGESTNAV